jgi:Cytochrome P450
MVFLRIKLFALSPPPLCCLPRALSNTIPLCTLPGQHWFNHRRLITPTFHFNVLENFCEVFSENANILIKSLEEASADGSSVNIYPLITKAALDIICGKWTKSAATYWTLQTKFSLCTMSNLWFSFRLSPLWLLVVCDGKQKHIRHPRSLHCNTCRSGCFTTETAMGIKVHAQQQADNEYVDSIYRWVESEIALGPEAIVGVNLIKIHAS